MRSLFISRSEKWSAKAQTACLVGNQKSTNWKSTSLTENPRCCLMLNLWDAWTICASLKGLRWLQYISAKAALAFSPFLLTCIWEMRLTWLHLRQSLPHIFWIEKNVNYLSTQHAVAVWVWLQGLAYSGLCCSTDRSNIFLVARVCECVCVFLFFCKDAKRYSRLQNRSK